MLMGQIEVVSGKVFKYICQNADEDVVMSLLTNLVEEDESDNFFTTCSKMLAVSNGICGVYGNNKIMSTVTEGSQGEHPIDTFRQNQLLPFIKSYLTGSGTNMSTDADSMTINEALRVAATKSVNVLLGPLVVEVASVSSEVLREYRRNNRALIKYFASDLVKYSTTDDGSGVGSELLMAGINAVKTVSISYVYYLKILYNYILFYSYIIDIYFTLYYRCLNITILLFSLVTVCQYWYPLW